MLWCIQLNFIIFFPICPRPVTIFRAPRMTYFNWILLQTLKLSLFNQTRFLNRNESWSWKIKLFIERSVKAMTQLYLNLPAKGDAGNCSGIWASLKQFRSPKQRKRGEILYVTSSSNRELTNYQKLGGFFKSLATVMAIRTHFVNP